ncbi:MAG TPA: hypothetical protein VG867_10110 [Rhizomicrobium sp.]|nr:hypothetical protein [Rhizomicrobium sp.]
MRTILFAEGVAGLIAAVASYLWGYLEGRLETRSQWRKALAELRDLD